MSAVELLNFLFSKIVEYWAPLFEVLAAAFFAALAAFLPLALALLWSLLSEPGKKELTMEKRISAMEMREKPMQRPRMPPELAM